MILFVDKNIGILFLERDLIFLDYELFIANSNATIGIIKTIDTIENITETSDTKKEVVQNSETCINYIFDSTAKSVISKISKAL